MTVKKVEVLLTEQEQELFLLFKEKIGIDKDHGAIKKALAIASNGVMFGEIRCIADGSQTLDETVIKASRFLPSGLRAPQEKEEKVFELPGRYNPEFEL
jgi:hypothetical protein